jgi:pyrimidine deaminase RibD-like protein
LSNRDKAWLKRALNLAATSTANKRHGCVIIRGGNVVGVGVNKYINKPFFTSQEHMNRCSIHAEVAAIRNAKGNVRGATVYVARINNQGEPKFSQPCANCQAVLDEYGVRRAVWT